MILQHGIEVLVGAGGIVQILHESPGRSQVGRAAVVTPWMIGKGPLKQGQCRPWMAVIQQGLPQLDLGPAIEVMAGQAVGQFEIDLCRLGPFTGLQRLVQ